MVRPVRHKAASRLTRTEARSRSVIRLGHRVRDSRSRRFTSCESAAAVMASHRPASEEVKGSLQSCVRIRFWDALAAIAIAFAIWKLFVAPRSFNAAGSQRAPRAVYRRLDGGAFRVADQRGHVVFLEFYASWCEPCKLELPLVEAWWRRHRDAIVMPIDVGERRSVAAEFARRYSLGKRRPRSAKQRPTALRRAGLSHDGGRGPNGSHPREVGRAQSRNRLRLKQRRKRALEKFEFFVAQCIRE